ncbi:uncharacterized protein TrAtP1_002501 [Trichoderma atroviride]|uniref:uncharacterized protein n=1 Tax=Hypocrea atroviridis TaxID=63577 RepID=UPI0033277C61|nr:hypothetical protein TrAtP1_002501 [Trichoderma atroviride]
MFLTHTRMALMSPVIVLILRQCPKPTRRRVALQTQLANLTVVVLELSCDLLQPKPSTGKLPDGILTKFRRKEQTKNSQETWRDSESSRRNVHDRHLDTTLLPADWPMAVMMRLPSLLANTPLYQHK